MRPTIALCMIAKNEAHNLGPLLQSVRGCFDEIHITDTGSTDSTLDFIQKINEHIEGGSTSWSGLPKIQVHHFKWIDDFSAARNYSFCHAKTDYLMWIDCDDSLSSAEEFINWRDTVLHTAHYWAATYNYAFDANGNVECQFIRERVVKNNFGFVWKYFVHEGIVQTENKPFWPARVTSWTVDHRRTDADRKADHNRNLRLFELRDASTLEPRMKYYYGKELVENGFPEKAGKHLLEALQDPTLDIHDRIMAFQYAAQSAMHAKAYSQVIDLCFNCLRLVPSRAEAWCSLGDAHLHSGEIEKAKQCYRYALQCKPDALGGVVVVFTPAYFDYPHTQLANIALNSGDHTAAVEHIEALKAAGRPSWAELERGRASVEDLSTIRTGLPQVDDIAIICPPMGAITDWDENTLATQGHGGSETAAIEVAKELHLKTGRPVKIFQPRAKREVMPSGVEYLPCGDLQGYIKNVKPSAIINWRHPTRLSEAPTYVWCHDLLIQGGEDASKYDSIFALSEFHKNYLHQIQQIPLDKIRLLFNGVNPQDFPTDVVEKNKLKVVFSSSPDRGLDRAIRIVEQARKQSGLELELHCFYGFKNMRASGQPQWIKQADDIEKMISERPWVKYHGFVNKKELMRHFKEASVWVYPANFIETYCITAIEALVAKAYPIVRDMGALKYTMREAIERGQCDVIDTDCETEAEVGIWANRVVEAIIDEKWRHVDIDPENYTWGKVADKFIQELGLSGSTVAC